MKKYNYNFIITQEDVVVDVISANPLNEKWSKEYIKNLTTLIFNNSLNRTFNQGVSDRW